MVRGQQERCRFRVNCSTLPLHHVGSIQAIVRSEQGTAPSTTRQASGPGRSAFGAGADDDDDEPLQLPAHLDTAKAKNRPGVSTATLSKAKRAQQQAEVELDKSVYEYDEVYDNMKAAQQSVQEARKQESTDRKVSVLGARPPSEEYQISDAS